MRTIRPLTILAALALIPAIASAQSPGAPRGGRGGRGGRGPEGPPPAGVAGVAAPMRARTGGVTALLNARRALELTTRQVVQLDSIERLQFAERKAFAERMRPMRDSLQARARTGARDGASRDSIRRDVESRRAALQPQLDQMRKRDSTLDAAAERVLNDTQRARLREMQAERRGFERGLNAGRGAGAPGGRAMRTPVRAPVRAPMPPRGGMRRPPMPESGEP